jgi:hypothetical protein
MSSQTEPTKGDTSTHISASTLSYSLVSHCLVWCSIQRAQYATDAAAAGADAVEPIQSGVTIQSLSSAYVFLCSSPTHHSHDVHEIAWSK